MSKDTVKNNIAIEGAQIVFRNFSGAEGKFNPKGSRNFSVLLDTDLAKTLQSDSWNVRWLDPKDESDEPQAFLQVKVMFGRIPPNIILISSRGKTRLDEESVSILDWAEIENVDVIIRPYNWEANGKSGVKAYLKALYVTIVEDEFASKYNNVPDTASSSMFDEFID